MDMTALFFPQGNDVVVTAQFPGISDGTGMSSEFWYKTDKTTPDTDPTSLSFESTVIPDPENAGQTMSQFSIPATDNDEAGAFWWRVDVIDVNSHRRTASCGTLLVEAV
jgi:hypothetical protein